MLFGTSSRVPASQACPLLAIAAYSAPSTATERSASSRMMLGPLPPSSRVTRLMVPAAWLRMDLPTAVDPVKATLRTSGWPLR